MEYFENPARFADLLNGFLFGGEQVIQPENVVEADRSVSGRVHTAGKAVAYQLFRDIFRRINGRMHVLLVAISKRHFIYF